MSTSDLSAMRKNKSGKEDRGYGGEWYAIYKRVKREEAGKKWLLCY